ncbi:WYL domain-containing protein [Treponema ruminis]|uniref:Putative DNA-binding transcriptional regulator YafY n=1 Tax=Treponema ruminis TaxID=744515 RepID=A0A7W8LMJ5_9SPIR|nr:WYL domain-containing protein [Treponema ruminis]MBB5226547.1 putative DNA-binding transcriptional regulator YafY [Treponema ruminis]QSI02222.1 WYL domain-containing protein [Treponema ruminis]
MKNQDDTRQSGKEIFRLFQLDALFQEEKYYNIEELCKRLEVSSATLNRDLRHLRDSYRAPLEFSRENGGYHYTSRLYKLASVFVPEEEMPAYSMVQKLFEMFQNTPLYRPLLNICETFESPVKSEVVDVNQMNFKNSHLEEKPWFETRIIMARRDVDFVDEQDWDIILKALKENLALEFDYETVSTNKKSFGRIIEPWQLIFDREQWYLTGNMTTKDNPDKKERRTIVIPKMKNIRLTKNHFTLPSEKEWQLSKYTVGRFGALVDTLKEPETYKFIFQGSALYFSHAPFSEDQKIEAYTGELPHKEGAILVSFSSNQPHAIMRDFFSYGADIIPLEPEDFVQSWKEKVRHMAEYL